MKTTGYCALCSPHRQAADGVLIYKACFFQNSQHSTKLSTDKLLPTCSQFIQYADFTLWQTIQWLAGEILESQLDYWKQEAMGDLPAVITAL